MVQLSGFEEGVICSLCEHEESKDQHETHYELSN